MWHGGWLRDVLLTSAIWLLTPKGTQEYFTSQKGQGEQNILPTALLLWVRMDTLVHCAFDGLGTPIFLFTCSVIFLLPLIWGFGGFVYLVGWLVGLVEIGPPPVAQAGLELTTVLFPQSQVLGSLL